MEESTSSDNIIKKNKSGKGKKPTKMDIILKPEQKEAKSIMMRSICTILDGAPGTSKSTLSMNVALSLLFDTDIKKIWLTRPPIELDQFAKNGAIPGDEKEKNQVYMQPFLDAIKANYNVDGKKARIERAFADKEIEFCPMPFIRGKNLGTKNEKCVVLVDEGQSCSPSTMYAILTRLGEGSKMFITMDLNQADLKGVSGGKRLMSIVNKVEGLEYIELKHNYRSKFVQAINDNWFPRVEK